jgi:galactose mutarotase-like enzyme
VSSNDSEKCLNGGVEGFSRVNWDHAEVLDNYELKMTVDNLEQSKKGNGVKFSRVSDHLEEGFPGKLQIE